jgi:hypothetical protein
MCRIVASILLKDGSIIPDETSTTLDCILKPAEGAFRTYLDRCPVADVFYGNHAGSPLRGHITWQRHSNIPPAIWTSGVHDKDFSPTQLRWAKACSRIISHQNSSWNCADFDQIYDWLRKCQDEHDATCTPSWSKSVSQPGIKIRLVDVEEKRIVPDCLSNECQYVSLSYMWGKSNRGVTTSNNLGSRMIQGGLAAEFETLPGVIRDACSVVQKLARIAKQRGERGEWRYLWVDSLCIVQDDTDDQNSQIPHMDKIYQQSLFTIVALSATEADCRLPGVEPGSRPIQIQRTEGTASWLLSSIPPTLDRVLKLPCYETRAWTLQERVLSNRRVYFSNWQVYFQCYRYVYQEAYDWPRQIVQSGSNMDFRFMPGGPEFPFNLSHASFSIANSWHIRRLHLTNQTTLIQWNQDSLLMYDQLVAELSGRNLTKPDDILKAFAGLVTYLEANQAGAFVAGIPLNVLDRALLWAPANSLKRRVLKPGTRRIPSWSWCAWEGQVRYTWATFGVLSRLMKCDVMPITSWLKDVFLEDRGTLRRVDRLSYDADDGSRAIVPGSASEYGIYPLESGPDGGQYLHFKTPVAPASLFSVENGQITAADAGDEWDFFLSADNNKMIKSFNNDPLGIFAIIVDRPALLGSLPIQTVVYRQRNRKEPPPSSSTDNNKSAHHPACWIRDRQGNRCGILLDYEQPMKDFFSRRDCWFVLLSMHTRRRGECVPVVAEARGDRFMLHAQLRNPAGMQQELALYNVLLVKEERGYMTRVGLAQMAEEAFVAAATQLDKWVILG